jgi:prevent-host-death family protein
MKRVQASTFKRHCLRIMDEVQATGEPIIVTKRGKPIVKVVPAELEQDKILGFTAGKCEIVGDIESPVWFPTR